ncbi:hypothetical protein G7K_2284-t1 [Saitoella complicata NRRL Y-17804]|uniref:Uncharacterized protein n=1 Tax=Saitoella complicata (strain BCRC 22490 / CBS 7301 / JCM 7358 / NBRC 10748 / NRRL Y-17804) TaxID=698492 RepID=A0A0E9NE18_SAICN|nr:hypothetical protein G7K_2284-t1 [Saitoella complicata NRRL Y-17804]
MSSNNTGTISPPHDNSILVPVVQANWPAYVEEIAEVFGAGAEVDEPIRSNLSHETDIDSLNDCLIMNQLKYLGNLTASDTVITAMPQQPAQPGSVETVEIPYHTDRASESTFDDNDSDGECDGSYSSDEDFAGDDDSDYEDQAATGDDDGSHTGSDSDFPQHSTRNSKVLGGRREEEYAHSTPQQTTTLLHKRPLQAPASSQKEQPLRNRPDTSFPTPSSTTPPSNPFRGNSHNRALQPIPPKPATANSFTFTSGNQTGSPAALPATAAVGRSSSFNDRQSKAAQGSSALRCHSFDPVPESIDITSPETSRTVIDLQVRKLLAPYFTGDRINASQLGFLNEKVTDMLFGELSKGSAVQTGGQEAWGSQAKAEVGKLIQRDFAPATSVQTTVYPPSRYLPPPSSSATTPAPATRTVDPTAPLAGVRLDEVRRGEGCTAPVPTEGNPFARKETRSGIPPPTTAHSPPRRDAGRGIQTQATLGRSRISRMMEEGRGSWLEVGPTTRRKTPCHCLSVQGRNTWVRKNPTLPSNKGV